MLKIKDKYIALKNIKCVEYHEDKNIFEGVVTLYPKLKIIYNDNSELKIPIENYGEYYDLSKIIAEKVGEIDNE